MLMRRVAAALVCAPLLFSGPSQAQTVDANAAKLAAKDMCDADCIRANSEPAAQLCARPIEAQAPIDYEWVDRPYSGFFQEADPAADKSGIVIYRGDSIRFLTPRKEWVRMTFECAYDVGSRKLAGVRVIQGRLGQLAPPPQATASSAPSPRPPKAAGQQQMPTQVNGAALAAAIQRAAQRPKTAQRSTPKPSRTMIISEPSNIEVEQMTVGAN
jgi:hypothetical protein